MNPVSDKPDCSGPVEIAPDIFWVGNEIVGDKFQCHVYLIRNGRNSILIDPGSSMITWPDTRRKIEQIMPVSDIRYLICHHQDPDITGCIATLKAESGRADLSVLTHWRSKALLVHYDWGLPFELVEEMDWQLVLENGRKLTFHFTPYLHFAGCFCTFDHGSGILFSSDIFGGFTEQFQLFAKDEGYLDAIRPFHEHYMPSREILVHGIREIEDLPIRMIAPQHGSIISEPLVPFFVNALKEMDCGLYLLPLYRDNIQEMVRLNQMLKDMMEAMTLNVRLQDTLDNLWKFLGSVTQFGGPLGLYVG